MTISQGFNLEQHFYPPPFSHSRPHIVQIAANERGFLLELGHEGNQSATSEGTRAGSQELEASEVIDLQGFGMRGGRGSQQTTITFTIQLN